MAEGLKDIIASLEKQRVAIEKALDALKEIDGSVPAASSPSGRGAAKTGEASESSRRGRISPEGRKRLAEAMKRRWAVKRAASTVKKTAVKKAVRAKRKAA